VKLVIRRHRPWQRLAVVVLIASVSVASVFLLDYEHWKAVGFAFLSQRDGDSLRRELRKLKNENEGLHYQLALTRRQENIDKTAQEKSHAEIVMLRTQLAAARKEVAFYRSAVGAIKEGTGPKVSGLQIKARAKSEGFGYTLLLSNVDRDNKETEGSVNIVLQGESGGKASSLGLDQLDSKRQAALAFKFRQFQLIEGTMSVPADFKPKTLAVELSSRGKSKPIHSMKFDWAALLN
jgi:hypothetical protein